jgi:hypothetical protein
MFSNKHVIAPQGLRVVAGDLFWRKGAELWDFGEAGLRVMGGQVGMSGKNWTILFVREWGGVGRTSAGGAASGRGVSESGPGEGDW